MDEFYNKIKSEDEKKKNKEAMHGGWEHEDPFPEYEPARCKCKVIHEAQIYGTWMDTYMIPALRDMCIGYLMFCPCCQRQCHWYCHLCTTSVTLKGSGIESYKFDRARRVYQLALDGVHHDYGYCNEHEMDFLQTFQHMFRFPNRYSFSHHNKKRKTPDTTPLARVPSFAEFAKLHQEFMDRRAYGLYPTIKVEVKEGTSFDSGPEFTRDTDIGDWVGGRGFESVIIHIDRKYRRFHLVHLFPYVS